jgi:hypothetical protein
MRVRALVVLAVLLAPAAVEAQGIRLPRIGRRQPPAALPPEAPGIARQMAYKRSRWTGESYHMLSSTSMPVANGLTARYTTFGAGAHSDYRFTDHLSLAVSTSHSLFGDPATINTFEIGTRFRPAPQHQRVRLFVDARAAYLNATNSFSTQQSNDGLGDFRGVSNYNNQGSHGIGAVAGAGAELALNGRWSITTSASTMRSRLRLYRTQPSATMTDGRAYWGTSYNFMLGINYNPGRPMLIQNPTR